MTIQDKARIIARNPSPSIPHHVRQSCQRLVIGKALPEYRKEIRPIDMRVVRKVYRTHYERAIV